MKECKYEILFKILWIGLTLYSIYIFSWLSFFHFTIGNLIDEKYGVWNLLLPNILTMGLLIFYTKELLIGYYPKSKYWNKISLLIFCIIIVILTFVQFPQYELLFSDMKSEYWTIGISLIIILTSYVGILMNRVLKLIESK